MIIMYINPLSPLITIILCLFLRLSFGTFLEKSVLSKRNQPDELEEILEKIATPGIFEKFMYAKKTARLDQKRYEYIKRRHQKEIRKEEETARKLRYKQRDSLDYEIVAI